MKIIRKFFLPKRDCFNRHQEDEEGDAGQLEGVDAEEVERDRVDGVNAANRRETPDLCTFFKKMLPGAGSEPGSSRFGLFSHFHHLTAEPQRLPRLYVHRPL
jgi:hypothetical protein